MFLRLGELPFPLWQVERFTPSPGTGLVDLSRKTAPPERKIRSYVSGDCRKSSDPNSVPIKSTGPTPGEGGGEVDFETKCSQGRRTGSAKSPSPYPLPEYREREVGDACDRPARACVRACVAGIHLL